MAETLITTPSAATANSYNTVANSLTYFAQRLYAERWAAAGEDTQRQALFTAMRIMESLRYIGRRSEAGQPLEWPRSANNPRERGGRWLSLWPQNTGLGAGLYDLRGSFYEPDAIPAPVMAAQCEIAFAMLLDPSLNDAALRQAITQSGRLKIDHTTPAATRLVMAYQSLAGLTLAAAELISSL